MTWTEVDISSLATMSHPIVVDVREVDEYISGHIPGAINIPLSVLADSIHKFPQSEEVFVVCQAGGRSARACEFLSQQQVFASTQFVNVLGGTGVWILEGNDIIVGEQPS